jgi:pentatricopeptide repeat protein
LDSRVQLFRRDPGYRDDLLKVTTSLIGSRCAWEDALSFVVVLRDAGIEPNVQVYGALIARAERERLPAQVLRLFEEMRSGGIPLNPIVCTPVIAALGRLDRSEDAERLLRTMEAQGQAADLKVFGALLAAYARRSDPRAVAAVERLHGELLARGLVPDARITGARLQAHANAGLLDQAFAFFETLLADGGAPHIGVCNVLIAACEHRGAFVRALGVFKDMLEHGTRPNGVTFAALMRTCAKATSPDVTLSTVDACIACGLVQPSAGYDADANRLSLWADHVLTAEAQWQLSAATLADVGQAVARFHLARGALSTSCFIEGPEPACRAAARTVQAWREHRSLR